MGHSTTGSQYNGWNFPECKHYTKKSSLQAACKSRAEYFNSFSQVVISKRLN